MKCPHAHAEPWAWHPECLKPLESLTFLNLL